VLCQGEKEFNPKEEAMSLSNVSRKMSGAPKEWDNDFGLTVQVVVRMKNCSLIRWRDRESIVDTQRLADSVFSSIW